MWQKFYLGSSSPSFGSLYFAADIRHFQPNPLHIAILSMQQTCCSERGSGKQHADYAFQIGTMFREIALSVSHMVHNNE